MPTNDLPSVSVLKIYDIDIDGDVLAHPDKWNEAEQGPPPRIEVIPDKKGHTALAAGDRILARITYFEGAYEARTIRKLDAPTGRVMGIVMKTGKGYILKPTEKKTKYDYDLPKSGLKDAKEGDLVIGEIIPSKGRVRQKSVRIMEILGQRNDPGIISLISLHETGLETEFSPAALRETEDMKVPPLKDREDLRGVPLVTIDGADARDFDDAVFAEETNDGFHLIVAIADVAYYVRPDSPLNKDAYKRGNSTYFPDRVLPMLPEALSNGLCSLRPNEDRACMAVHLWIDKGGTLQRYKFVRGLMRSKARLVYEQVQAAKNGVKDDITGPLMNSVINPLYEAYAALWQERKKRGALDLDLPERQVLINEQNEMTGVIQRDRLDSHKLIEEFMILANVAAAKALEDKKAPCVYRVHERPNPDKLDSVREFIEAFDLSLPKGQTVQPAQINQILHKAAEHPYSHLISIVILRAQARAVYHPENSGHFGLALKRYAHFTSPIRRYADLLVHRSLIRSHDFGAGGLSDEETVTLAEMADHISGTERTSIEAERNAVDRFTAAYLSEQIGAEFTGRISGVTRFGLFVELDESGADGIIPMRTLPDDRYEHDEHTHALIGRYEGRVYRMGAAVTVRLVEAEAISGSTVLKLAGDSLHGADIPGLTFKRRPGLSKQKKRGKQGKHPKRRGKRRR